MSGFQIPGDIGKHEQVEKILSLEAIEQNVKERHRLQGRIKFWSRRPKFVSAKKEFAVIASNHGYTQMKIAEFMGLSSHSTVNRYIKAYKNKNEKLRS